jgi:hypothetical protein
LARLYQERFPNDKVIIADAHQYLLDHYNEFDFIWSSPPCPSHSRARFWGFGKNGKKPKKDNYIAPELLEYEQGPCQDGYVQIGMKDKGGRMVPNCVPDVNLK